MRRLNALVVDDSSLNRRTIAAILGEIEGVARVDIAGDGAEALRCVESNPPDFIALDLEMPRLDGFEFLQLLMDRNPLPVVVISARCGKESVFRALELGAIDFLPKPEGGRAPLERLRRELVEKVRVVRQLSPLALQRSRVGGLGLRLEHSRRPARARPPRSVPPPVPNKVIVVGASTGGPRAIATLFRNLQDIDAAIVIAQHMPPRFTATFAQRLDRIGVVRVTEAKPYQRLGRGRAYVCPGGRCVEIVPSDPGPALRVVRPSNRARYAPSIDHLFQSAAKVLGDRVIAVVLTGMGDDGAVGVQAVARRRGTVLVEAPETAVVAGMPLAACRLGVHHQSLGIWDLADSLAALAKSKEG